MISAWSGGRDAPVWLRPRWSSDRVRGLFSFRTHGVSRPPFASLNVGLHVGDRAEDVVENRRRCAEALGIPLAQFVFAEQVHGVAVQVVTAEHAGAGTDPEHPPIPGVDALVTATPHLAIAVIVADCVPVLMYDRVHHVVAAVHSGWRGTAGHVVCRTLDVMARAFGTRPQETEVWLGPSIRRCCYEVDDQVASILVKEFGPRHVLPRPGRPGKYLANLQSCIRQDLAAYGVGEAAVHDTGVCTSCRTDVLFSHRAEEGKTGRQLAAVCLL